MFRRGHLIVLVCSAELDRLFWLLDLIQLRFGMPWADALGIMIIEIAPQRLIE